MLVSSLIPLVRPSLADHLLDIENCIEYCFGEVAIGSLPKHEGITEHEPSPSHLRKLRPYGEVLLDSL